MVDRGAVPSRADARRNRALVLQAARSAFEERGLAAPLGEIARRAGVGAGTVYRHFPSKEALFRASVADRLRLFADTATDLADAEDPGGVFFRFLASVVRLSARNKALCDALEAAGEAAGEVAGAVPSATAPGPEGEFLEALRVLLLRAQEAGAVREDVDLGDVHALLVGCMSMERRRPEEGEKRGGAGAAPGRMTALMCDGLRATGGSGRLAEDVTKPPPVASSERNETRCAMCDRSLPGAGTGRPARYCGGACRQRAHRARTLGTR